MSEPRSSQTAAASLKTPSHRKTSSTQRQAMTSTDQPEYDFDGNELPPRHNFDALQQEVSCVCIHEDEEDPASTLDSTTGVTGIGEHVPHVCLCNSQFANIDDLLEKQPDEVLWNALSQAKKRVHALEKALFIRHHALPPNTTHLAITHPDSNQLFEPVVPVDEIIYSEITPNANHPPLSAIELHRLDMHKPLPPSATPEKPLTPAAVAAVTVSPSPVAAPLAKSPPLYTPAGIVAYFLKWQGQHVARLPMSGIRDIILAFISSFCAIAIIAALQYNEAARDSKFLFPSFGASAVLLYSAPMSDFSQPRNVIGGHMVSALMGVIAKHLVFPFHSAGDYYLDTDYQPHIWLACALAVSLAITAQNLTSTIHPPGGATALIAIVASREVLLRDFAFVGLVAMGACIMVFVALLFNNLPRRRIFPKFWF